MSGLSDLLRKQSSTVAPNKQYPSGRFPMPDKHARLALQMLPLAKHLSDAQKARIRARALAILRSNAHR